MMRPTTPRTMCTALVVQAALTTQAMRTRFCHRGVMTRKRQTSSQSWRRHAKRCRRFCVTLRAARGARAAAGEGVTAGRKTRVTTAGRKTKEKTMAGASRTTAGTRRTSGGKKMRPKTARKTSGGRRKIGKSPIRAETGRRMMKSGRTMRANQCRGATRLQRTRLRMRLRRTNCGMPPGQETRTWTLRPLRRSCQPAACSASLASGRRQRRATPTTTRPRSGHTWRTRKTLRVMEEQASPPTLKHSCLQDRVENYGLEI
mmetsp:Transcript_28055/g.77213  ORF Transcript_28055/g.77213 Transcript_28055/m.77213 type:complete len:259 (+) Transcript_28055:1150-1926(+)